MRNRTPCLMLVLALAGCSRAPKPPAHVQAPVLQGRAGRDALPSSRYHLAVPGRPFRFPRDHASHPEYATEWWYYTGHLTDGRGHTYGYQWTFFRVGTGEPDARRTSAWAAKNIYFAHVAITDESGGAYHYFDSLSRGSLGEAGARTDRYDVHIGDWSGRLDGARHLIQAEKDGYGFALACDPEKPPVVHGEDGVSQKARGRGRASYYYSFTRMRTTGTLALAGQRLQVSGVSWFDHEFGSSQLAPNQVGWDWFSLQLDNGSEAMIYRMRDDDNRADPYSSGTLIDGAGRAAHLRGGDYRIEELSHWNSTATGGVYPSKWRVAVPNAGWDIIVSPTVANQEMRTAGTIGVPYWEGSVRIDGTVRGRPVHGVGYAELTGYATPLTGTL